MFVVRDGVVAFVPVEVGIAGEKHFEVSGDLKAGDQVVSRAGAEVPITEAVRDVLFGSVPAAVAVRRLMERDLKDELG